MNSSQILAFVSGKSGLGKSTTIINLANQLVELNKKVCVIDMDMLFGELHIYMDMEQFYDNKYTLYHILNNNCNVEQCLIYNDNNKNLCLLPSLRTFDEISFESENLVNSFKFLKKNFDYILLDLPNGLDGLKFFDKNIEFVDEIIFISSHNISSITNTDTLIEYFELKNLNKKMYLILTNYLESFSFENENLLLYNICNTLGISLLGYIGYDNERFLKMNLCEANIANKNISNYKEYEDIAKKIIGEYELVQPEKKEKKNKGFLLNPFSKKKTKKI